MIRILHLLTFVCGLLPGWSWAQGHLMIVGGNSETQGGWSDAPYSWAAAQAPNHRVAIVGTSSASNWLPDYFVSLGATFAKNFQVASRSAAHDPTLADSLGTYDCLFFRGGDQWDYLSFYQGTRLDSVVEAIYARGGVIAGTSAGLAILSGVDFTAENGTVYPEEMMADWDNQYVALADSFLPLLPGYLFDSHFVERGRFARLAGLMAHWQLTRGERIHGIGVDDKTALCIDPSGQTLAHGTAAVNFYFDDRSAQGFASSGSKPTIDALRLVQLLDGDSLHLGTGAIGGLDTPSLPRHGSEQARRTLLMSGSDPIADQTDMLRHLIEELGQPGDSVLIVSATSSGVSALLKDVMAGFDGAGPISILATNQVQDTARVGSLIRSARLFVLAANHPPELRAFLSTDPQGQRLDQRLRAPDGRTALVGDDARLAGPVFLDNYRQEYASYDGLLDFQSGLGLLRSSIVMPNSFVATNAYENTASGVPWAMVHDSLAYGLWLSGGMWAKYFVQDDSTRLISYGARPLLLLRNTATVAEAAATFDGSQRNVVGFDDMTLSLLDSSTITLGAAEALPTKLPGAEGLAIRIGPVPSPDQVRVRWTTGSATPYRWELISGEGRVIQQRRLSAQKREFTFSLRHVPAGSYWLRLLDAKGKLLAQGQVRRE